MIYTRQLALPFPQNAAYYVAEFASASANAEALTWLANPSQWPNHRLAVYGAEGSGKTHLLHVFSARHGAALLSGEAVRQTMDMPGSGSVAVDDADQASEPEALLHLLNAAAEARLPVLLTGRTPPARWPVTLPDLASRLRATTAVQLGQPNDDLLRAMLAQLLAQRQLRVDASVQDYLLARLPRHGNALREAAACLDRLSLESGRAVTRALAQDVLARMGAEEPEPETLPEAPRLL